MFGPPPARTVLQRGVAALDCPSIGTEIARHGECPRCLVGSGICELGLWRVRATKRTGERASGRKVICMSADSDSLTPTRLYMEAQVRCSASANCRSLGKNILTAVADRLLSGYAIADRNRMPLIRSRRYRIYQISRDLLTSTAHWRPKSRGFSDHWGKTF
jgi:hypothetical protein